MECKNCSNTLQQTTKFCDECGAKVVLDRVTTKKLVKDFFNDVLGWDNSYFRTFKTIFIAPDVVIKSYLSGTRKKFMVPFTFLAIGVGIATFIFGSFSEKYAELSSSIFGESFYETTFENLERLTKDKPEEYFDSQEYKTKLSNYKNEQLEIGKKGNKLILKYFNMMAFLLMPFYTYLAFLTFGRRYNYGEHLVINAYIQGFSMISSVVFFMASILFLPRLYSFMVFVTMFYYLLTYKRLYELSWGKAFLKLVIFLIILVISMIMITIIGAICAFLFLVIKKDILGM